MALGPNQLACHRHQRTQTQFGCVSITAVKVVLKLSIDGQINLRTAKSSSLDLNNQIGVFNSR